MKIAFTPVTATIIRISIYPESEEKMPSELFDGPDIKPRAWEKPTMGGKHAGKTDFQVGEFSVSVIGEPVTLAIARRGRVVQHLLLDGAKLRFDIRTSKLYGLGQGFHSPMNRRGSLYDMAVNGQRKGIIDSGSTTSAVPYLIGTDGWGLFFHKPWKTVFNLYGIPWKTGQNGLDGYCESHSGDLWDLFLVDGANITDAVTGYYEIAGKAPMPPKYAFGYQQSHRTLLYKNENFMKTSAAYFRESGFPCDMLIYLGTGYTDNGWNEINGSFLFNRRVFQDPSKDLSALQAENYKVMLHVTRCPRSLHGMISDEECRPNR